MIRLVLMVRTLAGKKIQKYPANGGGVILMMKRKG